MIRQTVDLQVHGPKVFRAFMAKPHFGFSFLKADPLKQVVELQTRVSWLSWGETLTVTVVNGDGGCKVVIEGRRTVMHSFLAKPQRAIAQLMVALAETYGEKVGPSSPSKPR